MCPVGAPQRCTVLRLLLLLFFFFQRRKFRSMWSVVELNVFVCVQHTV